MNFLPLWTARVWPTNSGAIVERRDHVLRTFFWRERFISSMRPSSVSSMYGPFLSERPIPRLLFLPSRHDPRVRRPRAPSGLVDLGRLAPRRHGVIPLPLALAAAHGMVDWVHDRAAHCRPEATPTHAASLADRDVLVVEVAHLTERGHAVETDEADLTGRQLQRRAVAFLGQELSLSTGASAELGPTSRLELDVVHARADRNVPDRQRVAGQDVGLRPRHHDVARLESVGGHDVTLLAVAVNEQGQVRRAVRIVFDALHPRRNAELFAPEVDVAQHPLVPAASMTHGDAPIRVAAVRPPLGGEEALLRRRLGDVVADDIRQIPPGRGRWLQGPDGHGSGALHELDLVAGREPHDGLLPARTPALVPAHPLELPLVRGGADVAHLHVEDALDGHADLDLVGVGLHLERHDVALFFLTHALLGHDRLDDDRARLSVHSLGASWSASNALRSKSAWRQRRS